MPEIRSPGSAPQHGIKGVFYGGSWLDIKSGDIEDFVSPADPSEERGRCSGDCSVCPRSKSRNNAAKDDGSYDVVIVGAGCIGNAIARELSKYKLSVLLLESADDVSSGATKGNSGIVHAGYDDKPGSLHAKYCWPGNQMFSDLDKELRFGYQKNGSLVLASNEQEIEVLKELIVRGKKNGVKNLRIIDKKELFELEPAVNPKNIAALHSPDAGNVIPYEFAIALAENAVDNGVELRIRREVVGIEKDEDGLFNISARHWEPKDYLKASGGSTTTLVVGLAVLNGIVATASPFLPFLADPSNPSQPSPIYSAVLALAISAIFVVLSKPAAFNPSDSFQKLVSKARRPIGGGGSPISVLEMLTGGSGSWKANRGETVEVEKVKAKFVINSAGGFSDKIANMIGDNSFNIKPRLGDYILLNRNQGHLTTHTLFPCPDPILGKGVLVQTTLWGNLILGPTARDTHKPEAMNMSVTDVQRYILNKCSKLVPSFDPKETIHAFCGARAKSDRGDWIIEHSKVDKNFIHVAGIDSPGLAGSPAIALEVVNLLKRSGAKMIADPDFKPNRAPIVSPKDGMRGLKMKKVESMVTDGKDEKAMAANVVCRCEKVTELEIVTAMRRSLPIDSTQAIRKRTRAGMGHCQGANGPNSYNCECRVKAIIARENQQAVQGVGGRPWPATTTLTERWIKDKEKQALQLRMEEDEEKKE